MKTNSKFKRIACIMMSTLAISGSFGVSNLNTAYAAKPKSSAQEAQELSKRHNKETWEKQIKELSDVYDILNGSKEEIFVNLSEAQQQTLKEFYKKTFCGNEYEFHSSGYINSILIKGENPGSFDEELIRLVPATYKKSDTYSRLDRRVIIPESYDESMVKISSNNTAATSNTSTSTSGGTTPKSITGSSSDDKDFGIDENGKALTKEAYEKKFYADVFKATRPFLRKTILKKLEDLGKKLKNAETNPVMQIIGSPAFKIGGGILGGLLILKNGGQILDGVRNVGKEVKHKVKDAWYKVSHKGFDLKHYPECLERIETRLRKELVGQDEAIERIIDIMRGYFASMVEAKENKEKFEGGLMLYLTGSPATGKSTMMKIIQEEMNLGTCVVRMSDVIEDKNNGAETVAARLTKPTIEKTKYTEIKNETPLIKQLNLRKPTLYSFDEIDKMRLLDSSLQKNKTGEISKINSIDELLRNFIDTGHIAGIDASGSILIATSNETDEDMDKLEPSLKNRYSPYRVKFKDFSKDDYKEIIKRGSVKLQEHYAKTFNANIEWSENAMDYFASKFVEEKAGGRCAEPLMMKVRSAIAVLRKNVDIHDKNLSIDINDRKNIVINLA
ncbi:MAG: AAA family ATPase [Clostridia bacterium]|nr:AAA family ATPase [Clostridia bacterium]